MPTVDFDFPDDPNGTQATGHVVCQEAPGDCTHADGETVTVIGITSTTPAPATPQRRASASATARSTTRSPCRTARGGHSHLDPQAHRGQRRLSSAPGYTSAPAVAITRPVGVRDRRRSDCGDRRRRDHRHRRRHGRGRLPHPRHAQVRRRAADDAAPRPPARPRASTSRPPSRPRRSTTGSPPTSTSSAWCSTAPSSPPTCRRAPWCAATCSSRRPDNAGVSQHVPLDNELMDGTKVPVPTRRHVLRRHLAAVPRADHRGHEGQAGADRVPQPAARRAPTVTCSCRPTAPMMGSGMGPMAMAEPDRPERRPTTASATRCARSDPQDRHVLQGQPGDPAPARRHHPVDQRRHAAPVDHPGGREHAVAAGRQRPERARHGGRAGPRCATADDGCQTFFYTNQQSARLMFYHDHAWGITRLNVYAGEAAGYLITDDTEKKLDRTTAPSPAPPTPLPLIVQDKTFVPGDEQLKDVKTPTATHLLRPGPHLGHHPLGQQGQLLVPPRLHAGAEPRRPLGHERLRPLDVRAVVLAAGLRHASTGRSPTPTTTRAASWTTRRPGSTRPTRSASPSRSPARRTSRRAWSSSTTPRSSTGSPTRRSTAAAQDLPAADAQRRQRPVLQLPVVRRRPRPGRRHHRGRSSKPGRARGGPDRPERLPDPGRRQQRRGRARLGADRQRGRLPARTRRDRRPAADHLDHRPDPVRRRQRRQALAAARAGRARRRGRGLLEVRRQDADPVQRRPGGLPGPRPVYDYYTGAPDLSPIGAPTILPGYGPNTRTVMQVTIADTTPHRRST